MVIIIKLIVYISLLPLLCAWYLIKLVFVVSYYMLKLTISAILQIFQIVFNNIRGNKVYYDYSESSPQKEKIDDTISLSRAEYNAEIKKIRIVEIDKELEKYKSLLNELLKDYKCDFISEKDYDDFKQKYLYEINKLNIEKENMSNVCRQKC